jgi:hypothetical protein
MRITDFVRSLAPTACIAGFLVLAVTGCGSSGSGDENYSQKFEPPPTEAKSVADPPDAGAEQSPRERRKKDAG